MVYELKITSGFKKMCKNSMVIRYFVKKLVTKNRVTRPMKYLVNTKKILKSSCTQT